MVDRGGDTDTVHTTVNGHKTCSTCHLTLPVIHFTINRRMKDGLQNDCRQCMRSKHNRQASVVERRMSTAGKYTLIDIDKGEHRRDYCLRRGEGEGSQIDFGEAITEEGIEK